MNARRRHNPRDERGATLIMVIGFMVVVGLASASMLTLLVNGARSRGALDKARNTEYAADGAVERAITDVRSNMGTGQATAPCGSGRLSYLANQVPNNIAMQVDCNYSQSLTLAGFWQRNVVFTACAPQSGNTACGTKAIITAQVNFQSTGSITASTIDVNNTIVQSWSVNS